jgi:hypothetical protein
LLLYPLISAAVCLAVYMIARNKPKIHTGLLILASGISLVSSALHWSLSPRELCLF